MNKKYGEGQYYGEGAFLASTRPNCPHCGLSSLILTVDYNDNGYTICANCARAAYIYVDDDGIQRAHEEPPKKKGK